MATSFTSVTAGQVIEAAHINQFAGNPPASESPINRLEEGQTWYGEDSTNTNSYAVTLTPAPAAYQAGMLVHFKVANGNTGAVTLDVNGLGAQSVVLRPGRPLVGGEIVAGQVVFVVHDGSQFQLLNPTPPSDLVRGTGASGQVARWTGGQSLGGSPDLVWDAANGRLGVGTATPTTRLECYGNVNYGVEVLSRNASAGASAWAGHTLRNDAGTIGWLWTGSSAYSNALARSRTVLEASSNSSGLLFQTDRADGDILFRLAGVNRMRLDEVGRLFWTVPASAPADADLGNSQVSVWVNEATGELTFRVRYSGGALKTGTVSLA